MTVSEVLFRRFLGVNGAVNNVSTFKNILQKCILRKFTGTHIRNGNSRSFWTSSQKLISVSRVTRIAENVEEKLNSHKAILNNVILFKDEKTTGYRLLVAFAFVQLFGLLTMASNVYRTFCQDLFNPDKDWMTRLKEHTFSVFAICAGCFFGPVIFFGIFLIMCKSVRRIILHKGGEKVTIVTYNPIPSKSRFTIPLSDINCRSSRHAGVSMSLAIRNRRFYYFMKNDSNFPNGDLFDSTVGIRRDLD